MYVLICTIIKCVMDTLSRYASTSKRVYSTTHSS